MRPKIVLAALTMMAALGGWATTEAADRDDRYPNGDSYYYRHYHHHPHRHAYYSRHYTDRSYTYYYERDGRRHYSYYDERPHRYGYGYYSYNGVDPYAIDRHDTN